MSFYRKRPVVIEARLFYPGFTVDAEDVAAWCGGRIVGDELEVPTLEDGADGRAKHVASAGDYIIRGVSGEFYPCKPDIFAETYEAVE